MSDEDELLSEPRWFPMDLDKQTGAIRFCDIGPEWPRWQEFLGPSGRDIPQKLLSAKAAFDFVKESAKPAALNFIWHSSYCCSTAIATALDVRGSNFSVFEPQVLISLAHARRQADRERKGDISWLSDAIFRLIARPFTEGALVTIKPASTSNYLAFDAFAKTKGKMLFLYSDCASFLTASMRYGEHRRQFVRTLFRDIRREGDAAQRWTSDAAADLTDLEVAGLVWQWQIARFRACIARFGDRAASLDCDAFLARPKETIEKLWAFFGLPGTHEESPLFTDPNFMTRHVKFTDEAFTPEGRLGADQTLDRKVLNEIERVVEASGEVFPENRGALPLGNALLTVEKAYPR